MRRAYRSPWIAAAKHGRHVGGANARRPWSRGLNRGAFSKMLPLPAQLRVRLGGFREPGNAEHGVLPRTQSGHFFRNKIGSCALLNTDEKSKPMSWEHQRKGTRMPQGNTGSKRDVDEHDGCFLRLDHAQEAAEMPQRIATLEKKVAELFERVRGLEDRT